MSRRNAAAAAEAMVEAEEVTEETEEVVNDGSSDIGASFESLDTLLSFGINASDLKKLQETHIHTVEALKMTSKKRLLEIKGFSDAKIDKLLNAANQCGKEFGFQTGRQLMEKREAIIRITTGCDDLDNLLGGGVESGSITEAFGEFRTGKTQLAHTLAVAAQLDASQNGGNGKVIYIDTEGTFRPNRIQSIAERFGVNGSEALDNIMVARAFNHESQHNFLLEAAAHMVQDRYSLIIVDSCTALFRVDFLGRGQLSERQQKLGQFLAVLTRMAEEFNVACFVTNQVVSDPAGNPMGFAVQAKPIGGNIMAHACCTRLLLRKGKGENRICKIYDSPCLPENECTYALGEGGVENPKD